MCEGLKPCAKECNVTKEGSPCMDCLGCLDDNNSTACPDHCEEDCMECGMCVVEALGGPDCKEVCHPNNTSCEDRCTPCLEDSVNCTDADE